MTIFTEMHPPFIIKPATNLPEPEPPIRNGLEVYSDEFIFALGTKYVPINDLYWHDKYVKQARDLIDAKVRSTFSVFIQARHSRGYGKSWTATKILMLLGSISLL